MVKSDFIDEHLSAVIPKDSPSGSGISSTKFVHYVRDFPPGFGPNVPVHPRMERGGRGVFWRRQVGAVKSKLGMGGKCDEITVKKNPKKIMNGKEKNSLWKGNVMGSCDGGERDKVLEVLRLFREKCEEISKNGEGVKRVDLKAKNVLTNEGIISRKCPLLIGPVPGVEVGDRFRYRVELMIVGLHSQFERGIDVKVHGGVSVATCIVATEGHSDKMGDPETLTYRGEGGSKKAGGCCDQTLSGGNLALWKSMEVKNPVRVVRGFRTDVYDRVRKCDVKKTNYVYDGLYEVRSCEKKGPLGNMIFEFKLSRCPGQPTVAWKSCKRNRI